MVQENPLLKKVYDNMLAKQAGVAVFKSGSKAANIGPLQDLESDSYEITQSISYDYWGSNLDTSGEEHFHVTFGTQVGKLIDVDLFGIGSATTLNTRDGRKNKEEFIGGLKQILNNIDVIKREKFLNEIGAELVKGATPNLDYYRIKKDGLAELKKRIKEALLVRKTTSVMEKQVNEILDERL
jgi:hypothetical protein